MIIVKLNAKEQDFGGYPDTTGGHLLERLDRAVEVGDEQSFTLAKQEIWHQVDDGLSSDEIVSPIVLSEIDWNSNPVEYFTNWQRLSVGYIPNKYRDLFVIK